VSTWRSFLIIIFSADRKTFLGPEWFHYFSTHDYKFGRPIIYPVVLSIVVRVFLLFVDLWLLTVKLTLKYCVSSHWRVMLLLVKFHWISMGYFTAIMENVSMQSFLNFNIQYKVFTFVAGINSRTVDIFRSNYSFCFFQPW
jgi:hypothetical protein